MKKNPDVLSPADLAAAMLAMQTAAQQVRRELAGYHYRAGRYGLRVTQPARGLVCWFGWN